MKANLRQRNVLIVLWLAGSGGRKQLAGLLRYVNEAHNWNLRLITDPRDFNDAIVGEARSGKVFDGFIGHASREAVQAMTEWNVPSVLIDYPPPGLTRHAKPDLIMVDDDERIGALAADYFLDLGRFASFGFVPDTEQRGWSRLRERGFRNRLRKRGVDANTYSPERGKLPDWLSELPRPAAVLASHDFRAKDVLDVCRQEGLAVPGDISVLGIDNDEIICENTRPPLSSVRIDHEQFGYLAASELDRAMARRRRPAETRKMLVPALGIVERGSTDFTSPVTVLVNRMAAFIQSHAADPIRVDDVVSHVGVSRSLADLRFRQSTGLSIHEAIEKKRLELVCQRLRNTDLTIDRISRLSGFANPQRLKYVFKARYGTTMSEFRASVRDSTSDQPLSRPEK